MKQIYIVLAHTGTLLSKMIKVRTGAEYTHVSIALDKDLYNMYSFGRKNPYIAFIGGFVKEGAHFGTFKRFYNTKICVYELNVSDEQYLELELIIDYMKNHKNEYKFNVLGLFLAGFNKNIKFDKTYYCAEFVKHVLKEINVDVSNLPEVIKPESFKDLKNSRIIYKGLFRKYKVKKKNKRKNINKNMNNNMRKHINKNNTGFITN